MRKEFSKQLKAHDWYHAYSDDPSCWRRGREQLRSLQNLHAQLKCPYSMTQLSRWNNGYIVEKFVEEEPGRWFMQPRVKYAASVTREELITQATSDEIEAWLGSENNDGE